jgi:hypothetical protein
MMPSVDCLYGRRKLRIAAFLSTITLLTLSGCGGTGETLATQPPPSAPSGQPNSAPTISGAPALSVNAGQTYSFTPQASDSNGDDITFEIQNRPSWATFNAQTGRLSGTPTAAQVGSYANVIISAYDGHARSSLPAFSINVGQVGGGTATLTWVPPTQRTDGSTLSNLAGYRVYYSRDPNVYTNSVLVSNAGVTSYVVDNLVAGTWYFAVTAVDASGQESGLSNTGTKTIS